jgi:hypothetical protein
LYGEVQCSFYRVRGTILTILNVLRQCPLVLLVTAQLQRHTALRSEEGKVQGNGLIKDATEERSGAIGLSFEFYILGAAL